MLQALHVYAAQRVLRVSHEPRVLRQPRRGRRAQALPFRAGPVRGALGLQRCHLAKIIT